jgi:hypothetical protein
MKINTELVAPAEHIIDDAYDVFPNIDDETAQKIVEFAQAYIRHAVEVTLEFPGWFAEEE